MKTETEKRLDADAEEAWIAEIRKLRKANQKLEQFIGDAAAYLRLSMAKGEKDSVMLTTLFHDLSGLAGHEMCFVPRVSGYELHEETEHRERA